MGQSIVIKIYPKWAFLQNKMCHPERSEGSPQFLGDSSLRSE
jgi:hypothetical protein